MTAQTSSPMGDDFDAWWREQSQRKPKRYQVWTRGTGGIRALLASTDVQGDAVKLAQDHRPAQVWEGTAIVLRCGKNARDDWGPLAPPRVYARDMALRRGAEILLEALDEHPEGIRLSALRKRSLCPDRVRQLVEGMREGRITYELNERIMRSVALPRHELELVRDPEDRRYLVVRRVAA